MPQKIETNETLANCRQSFERTCSTVSRGVPALAVPPRIMGPVSPVKVASGRLAVTRKSNVGTRAGPELRRGAGWKEVIGRTQTNATGPAMHAHGHGANAWGHTHFNTYRNALAFDAVHDSEGRAQIREPGGAQFPYLLAERAFCNKTGDFDWSSERSDGFCSIACNDRIRVGILQIVVFFYQLAEVIMSFVRGECV